MTKSIDSHSNKTLRATFLKDMVLPALLVINIFSAAFQHLTTITEGSFYLLIVLFSILIKKGHWRKYNTEILNWPFNRILVVFILWCLLTSLLSTQVGNSIHDWYRYLLSPAFIIFLIVFSCASIKTMEIVISSAVLSLALVLLWSLAYFYGLEHAHLTTRLNAAKETAISINNVGFVAVIPFFLGIGLLINAKKIIYKIIYITCITAALSAMILSATRGAIIGFIAPLLLLLMIAKKKALLFFLLSLVGIAIFLSPARNLFSINNISSKISNGDRPDIWLLYSKVVADNPITGLGFGFGNYTPEIYKKYMTKLPPRNKRHIGKGVFYFTHNIFLDTAVRTGYVGVILFFVILAAIGKMLVEIFINSKNLVIKRWGILISASLMSIIIQGMLTDILSSRHSYIFYLILAFTSSLYFIHQKDNNIL